MFVRKIVMVVMFIAITFSIAVSAEVKLLGIKKMEEFHIGVYCIDGYKYVIVRDDKGKDVTMVQMFDKIDGLFKYPPQPVKCK